MDLASVKLEKKAVLKTDRNAQLQVKCYSAVSIKMRQWRSGYVGYLPVITGVCFCKMGKEFSIIRKFLVESVVFLVTAVLIMSVLQVKLNLQEMQ